MEILATYMEDLPVAAPTNLELASGNWRFLFKQRIRGPAVNLSFWRIRKGCNTIGCIAGHTLQCFSEKLDPRFKNLSIGTQAIHVLELENSEAEALFHGHPQHWNNHITGADCARIIRFMTRNDVDEMDIEEEWDAIGHDLDERVNEQKDS